MDAATTVGPTSMADHLAKLTRPRPGEAVAEFRIGLASAPYLADHAVDDSVVLPGALYVEMARCIHRRLSPERAVRIANVQFRRAIVLGKEDAQILVQVRDQGDAGAAYEFHDAAVEDGVLTLRPGLPPAATLVIRPVPDAYAPPAQAAVDSEPEGAVREAMALYQALRQNGNQYGLCFQRLAAIWRTNTGARARMSVRGPNGDRRSGELDPSLLDAFTHLLASFLVDHGRPFVLQSIEQLDVLDADVPDDCQVEVTLARTDGSAGQHVRGDVRAFDRAGRVYLDLRGVSLVCLDRDEVAASEVEPTHVVVSANFTADPVEDTLRFWADQFGLPIDVSFAPYDQVCQQLLDPGSVVNRNRDGINVLLLALEEWAGAQRLPAMALPTERADRALGGRRRCVLPNGLEIAHLNHYETEYLYHEIFEDSAYLRHGIRLADGATVVDIGANIGMFSLFVMSRWRNPRIYAFEPAPAVYDLLKANCEAYSANARAVNMGVCDRPTSATFTFYENSSVFSGFHADAQEDGAALQTIVHNTLVQQAGADELTATEEAVSLTSERLRSSTHECRMTSVSEIMREHGLERIDLLKIDAEKSEWEVLAGIEDDDWSRIDQLVIEIHDRTGELATRIERLLQCRGFQCALEREQVLRESGLFTLYATRHLAPRMTTAQQTPAANSALRRAVQDVCDAAGSAARRAGAPLVICVCPRSPAAEADPALAAALDAAEQQLLSAVAPMPNVTAVSSDALRTRYPTTDIYDPHGHRLGHIPYTARGYAVIGTAVFRAMFRAFRKPVKVIVLDCDNTLWKGVVAEDSVDGIVVGPGHKALQAFMLHQMNAGVLLCLCSKNNEEDVLAVFDRRTDMVLKRDHLAAWRINWNSKADNLRSLARELDLGLDSFVFVDDSPIECADVRTQCPSVLTLQLPEDDASFAGFLDRVWAFDHATVTAEDRNRTRMYQENAKRQQFRAQLHSLRDFIAGLALRIDIADVTDDELARVSQLTLRTNQFNSTTVRRSESELRQYLGSGTARCLAVRVADRFGDYGLVGVVLFDSAGDRYHVDSLLLSCRVLGRGVEHAVLAHLGRAALADGKALVEVAYRPSARNAPVREFLESVDRCRTVAPDGTWSYAAGELARLTYEPDASGVSAHTAGDGPSEPPTESPDDESMAPSETMQRIADDLFHVDRIADAVERFRTRNAPGSGIAVFDPNETLETSLLRIWRRVLGNGRVGATDNFFEVGGTSLRAVQLVATVRRELRHSLSVVTLFECPTVAALAEKLRAASTSGTVATAAAAAERGQRRRRYTRRNSV